MDALSLKPGLYFIGSQQAGSCGVPAVETIEDKSGSWKSALEKFGPWEPCILDVIDDLDAKQAWLAKGYEGDESVFILDKCHSTMDALRQINSRSVLKNWDSVIAVIQTAGRGQHGRKWLSAPGNLFASLCWPPPGTQGGSRAWWTNMTSLLAGAAIADFFSSIGIDLEIKWPNDLLYKGRKICGILVEEFGNSVVVGVGVNIESAPESRELCAQGSIPAASLSEIGLEFSPLDLWLKMVSRVKAFFSRIICYDDSEFFINHLTSRLAWKKRRIVIRNLFAGEISGILSGISRDGGLEIIHNGRIKVIHNGRISLQ